MTSIGKLANGMLGQAQAGLDRLGQAWAGLGRLGHAWAGSGMFGQAGLVMLG